MEGGGSSHIGIFSSVYTTFINTMAAGIGSCHWQSCQWRRVSEFRDSTSSGASFDDGSFHRFLSRPRRQKLGKSRRSAYTESVRVVRTPFQGNRVLPVLNLDRMYLLT